jgi:hypothetical protein
MLSSGSRHVDWPGSVVSFPSAAYYSKNGMLARRPGKDARRGALGMRRLLPAARKLHWPGHPCRLYHPNLRLPPMAPGVGRRALAVPRQLARRPCPRPSSGQGRAPSRRPAMYESAIDGCGARPAQLEITRPGKGAAPGLARLPGACCKWGCTVTIWEFGSRILSRHGTPLGARWPGAHHRRSSLRALPTQKEAPG